MDEIHVKLKADNYWREILRCVESLHGFCASIRRASIALSGAGAAGREALRYFQGINLRNVYLAVAEIWGLKTFKTLPEAVCRCFQR